MNPLQLLLCGATLFFTPIYLAWRGGAYDDVDQHRWLMGKPLQYIIGLQAMARLGFWTIIAAGFIAAFEGMWRP